MSDSNKIAQALDRCIVEPKNPPIKYRHHKICEVDESRAYGPKRAADDV